MDPLSILLFLVLFALSALVAGSEIAILSVPPHKVKALLRQDKHWARDLQKIKGNTDTFLITVAILINLLTTVTAAFATQLSLNMSAISGIDPAIGVLIATVIITLLLIIFGEILPKSFATSNAEFLALRVSGLFVFLQTLLFPIIRVLGKITRTMHRSKSESEIVTEEDIESLIEMGKQHGIFEKWEYEKIKNMLDFYEVTVQEIMTPRVNLDSLEDDVTVDQALEEMLSFSHSRIPIYNNTIDDIRGIITVRDLLALKEKGAWSLTLEQIQLKKIMKVPLTKPIHKVLDMFKKTRQQIAIVMDEYGWVAGIVSLEDVVEEVFGDIQDEIDNEKVAIVKDGNSRRVQWFVMLTDIMKLLHLEYGDVGISEEAFDGETVSYFVTSHLEKLPSVGEQFILDIRDHDDNIKGSILFEILEVQNNAINEVKICKQ